MRLKDGLCRLKRREETLQEFLRDTRLTGEVFEDVFSASLLGALVHFERAFKPRNSAADSDGRWGCHFSAGVSPHLARPTGPAPAQIRCPNRSAVLGVLGAFVSFMTTTAMIFWLMMMMLQQTCRVLTSPRA